MQPGQRKQLNVLFDLHSKDLIHPNFVTGGIADMLTVENFDEIMAMLPPSVEELVARWVRRIPRDPNVETLDPLPDEICELLFAWVDEYDARPTNAT